MFAIQLHIPAIVSPLAREKAILLTNKFSLFEPNYSVICLFQILFIPKFSLI